MARHIKSELGWKQKAKENGTFGAKLFGIVRNVYIRVNHSKWTEEISAYVTAETAENCSIRAEQEEAKTTYFLRRRMLTT